MLKTFHITQDLLHHHGDTGSRRRTEEYSRPWRGQIAKGRRAMRPVDPSREAVALLKLRAEAGLRLPADGCTGRVGGGNG